MLKRHWHYFVIRQNSCWNDKKLLLSARRGNDTLWVTFHRVSSVSSHRTVSISEAYFLFTALLYHFPPHTDWHLSNPITHRHWLTQQVSASRGYCCYLDPLLICLSLGEKEEEKKQQQKMTTITIIQAAMIIFFPPWIRWAASSSSSSQRALAPACTVTNQNLHGTPLLQFSFLLAIVPIVAVVVQVVAANSGRDHSATATQNGDALHCYYSGSSIIRICQLEDVNFQFAVTTAALTSQPASRLHCRKNDMRMLLAKGLGKWKWKQNRKSSVWWTLPEKENNWKTKRTNVSELWWTCLRY